MDDEDEFDSFFSVIDDAAAIAALNREEEKLVAATQRVDPPPAKKPRLDNRTVSIPEFSQLPIVLGLEDDYFTRTKGAPINQRNEDSRPPPAKHKPFAHPVQPQHNIPHTSAAPTEHYRNPPQPSSRPHQVPVTPQSLPRPHAQRVVSDGQRAAQFQKQDLQASSSKSAIVPPVPSSSQHKPHSAGATTAAVPQPRRQHTPQRQYNNVNAPAAHARNGYATPPGGRASPMLTTSLVNRNPTLAGVTPVHAPPIQRNNSLKRQHSFSSSSHEQEGTRLTQGGGGNPDHKLRLELDILRAQLEQTKARETELKRLYEEEKNARFANIGQVSVVTANMEKLKQSHANEVTRLRAERDAADTAKEELKKAQAAEIERIKTQFTFRQHELETTSRKPPWSAHAKKVYSTKLGTPIKTPAQIRAWNNPPPPPREPGPSNIDQTPRRARFNDDFATPSAVRTKAVPNKKSVGILPGFFNSFDTPTKPMSQRAKHGEKGKSKMHHTTIVDDDGQEFFAPAPEASMRSPPSSPTPIPLGLEDHPMEDSTSQGQDVSVDDAFMDDLAPSMEVDGDVRMGDEVEDGQQDMELGIEPQNWREELHRLLFAHTAPASHTPTLQMLFNTPLAPDTSIELSQTYASACRNIMEHLGTLAGPVDWNTYMQVFSVNLADLAWVMTSIGALSHLTALLDLLGLLSYSIPAFNSTLLKPSNPDIASRILHTVNHTICTHMTPGSPHHTLARSVLSLLEALSLDVPEEDITQLSVVLRCHDVLATLLNKEHSSEFLSHVMRMLSLLASNPALHKHLLAYPNTADGEPVEDKDLQLLPHLQTICYYLVDPDREGSEHDDLKRHIITFISTLSLAHVDAYSIILNSRMLIPSVIIYLSNISRPLWEDDEDALSYYPGQIAHVIEQTVRSIALLHHLVFSSDPPFDVRLKLHRPPARHLIGAGHVFIVTLGRCAFTSSPEWIDEEQYIRLEQATGMAKMLLEHVVPGEELDVIWTSLNADDDEEEEREAQRLHPTDDSMD